MHVAYNAYSTVNKISRPSRSLVFIESFTLDIDALTTDNNSDKIDW